MLDVLKQMEREEIFKILPNDDLGSVIRTASCCSDIELLYDPIQRYLKNLCNDLAYRHNVNLGGTISDFSDKFSYEMFDMAFTCTNHSNGIYQKETSYGKAGNFTFGLEMLNATFTLEERKLLKLINHYYISLTNKDDFTDNYFFIPLDSLRLIFPKVNNVSLKRKIVDTCNRLNSKIVYWDLSKTRYRKKLEVDTLYVGKKETIVKLNVLFLPKKNKNGINGEATEIKGIICRISRFMKLRFALSQISNRFPVSSLESNYLSFVIAEKIDYLLHMQKVGVNKKKTKCRRSLRDLTDEIYLYCNHVQIRDTYLFKISNDANSKDSIFKFLEAIINVLNNLSSMLSFKPILLVRSKEINLESYMTGIKVSNMKCNVDDQVDQLYNDIVSIGKAATDRAPVRYLIATGNVSLELKF